MILPVKPSLLPLKPSVPCCTSTVSKPCIGPVISHKPVPFLVRLVKFLIAPFSVPPTLSLPPSKLSLFLPPPPSILPVTLEPGIKVRLSSPLAKNRLPLTVPLLVKSMPLPPEVPMTLPPSVRWISPLLMTLFLLSLPVPVQSWNQIAALFSAMTEPLTTIVLPPPCTLIASPIFCGPYFCTVPSTVILEPERTSIVLAPVPKLPMFLVASLVTTAFSLIWITALSRRLMAFLSPTL